MEAPFIIAIVAIIGGLGYAAFEQKEKTRRAELASGGDAKRIADLEERIRTLERIVTDQGYQLEEEFRRLERSA